MEVICKDIKLLHVVIGSELNNIRIDGFLRFNTIEEPNIHPFR